jgi:general secretion pathway protein I
MGQNMRQKPGGFTLIEVLVAMVIMTSGVLVLANAWTGNFARVKNARINNTIAGLLDRKMIEIEVLYKDKPVEEIKDEEAGDFGPMYPGYRWEAKSKEFEMPDMSSSLIAREGGADQMLLTIVQTMQDYIKQAVKEVSVSVLYKPKKGLELKQTVTSYFVDYSKELPMPGGVPAPGGGASPATPAGGAKK